MCNNIIYYYILIYISNMNIIADQSAAQTGSYLFALCFTLLCYGFLSAPNYYTFFYSVASAIFLSSTNVIVFTVILIGAGCVPLAYHFLQDDYVLLNMLTYFPYPELKSYYYMLAAVCVTYALFIGFYVLYFFNQKN